MMERVWGNLLSNAVKYSLPQADHRIEIEGTVHDGMYVFSVRDHGVGFDQRYAGKLFGMFQRLHDAAEFKGSGIGLAITKRIIERHGGEAWAEGRLGEGAVFYFSLPIRS
jgi:two-component system, chemotaxis family, sensor kinase Cph1